MKKINYLLLLLFMMITLSACNEEQGNLEASKDDQFIVGMECAYAPFNWTETKKTAYNYPIDGTEGLYADGYDVQMAKAVAASLGKILVIKAIDWDGLIPALESGIIDAVIAGMSPTDERKLSIDFSEAYYTSTHVIVMNETSKYKDATSLTDFAGANVVGQIETLYDSLIDQLVGATHMTPLADVPTIITAITSGRADCTILEEPVAKGVIASNPSLTYIKLTSSFEVSEEDIVVSIGFKKGNEDLVKQVNDILSAIPSSVREALMVGAISRNE